MYATLVNMNDLRRAATVSTRAHILFGLFVFFLSSPEILVGLIQVARRTGAFCSSPRSYICRPYIRMMRRFSGTYLPTFMHKVALIVSIKTHVEK